LPSPAFRLDRTPEAATVVPPCAQIGGGQRLAGAVFRLNLLVSGIMLSARKRISQTARAMLPHFSELVLVVSCAPA